MSNIVKIFDKEANLRTATEEEHIFLVEVLDALRKAFISKINNNADRELALEEAMDLISDIPLIISMAMSLEYYTPIEYMEPNVLTRAIPSILGEPTLVHINISYPEEA